MKTAGIALDTWKLPIFRRRLDEAGYSYTEHPGITKDTSMLNVKTERLAPLQRVIEAAQLEAKGKGNA